MYYKSKNTLVAISSDSKRTLTRKIYFDFEMEQQVINFFEKFFQELFVEGSNLFEELIQVNEQETM